MNASARSAVASLCLLGVLCSAAARAQTYSPIPEWHYSEGHLLNVYTRGDGPAPTWERVLGLASSTQPKWEGANAYKTSAGPTFDIRYKDLAFFSAGEGFGVNLYHTNTARAGFALTYDLGRDQDDGQHLGGLGDYGISPQVKVFAEYLLFPVTFRADLRHSFGGEGGYLGDLSIYMPVAGKKDRFFVFAGPSMSFADANNSRHVFGVSPKQAANSGYPEHHLGGGTRSYSFGLSGGYFFTRHWLFEGLVAAEQLVGGACSAPFVQQCGQLDITVTVDYRW